MDSVPKFLRRGERERVRRTPWERRRYRSGVSGAGAAKADNARGYNQH